MASIHMRVDLSCRNVRVTEHLLQGTKVRSALQQVRRERVPQCVRVKCVKADTRAVLPHDCEDPASREPATADIQKDR